MTSGYTQCKCRDYFKIVVSDDMGNPDFCDDCKKAGCPDYQGVKDMSQECQRPDAYGASELIHDAAEAQELFGDDELEACAARRKPHELS